MRRKPSPRATMTTAKSKVLEANTTSRSELGQHRAGHGCVTLWVACLFLCVSGGGVRRKVDSHQRLRSARGTCTTGQKNVHDYVKESF